MSTGYERLLSHFLRTLSTDEFQYPWGSWHQLASKIEEKYLADEMKR